MEGGTEGGRGVLRDGGSTEGWRGVLREGGEY